MRERFTLLSTYLYNFFMQVTTRFTFTTILLFTITLAFAQPANDDCNNATPIPTDGSCQTFDNTNATVDVGNGNCVTGTFNVWFSFVAQGPDYDASITSPSPTFKPELTLLEFDPTPCDFASANQLDCGGAITGSTLVIGQTYYLVVTSATDEFGNFEICLDNPLPLPAPPNDDPCSPQPITANGSCTPGTTIDATGDFFNPGCDPGGAFSENTVWYSTSTSAGNNSLNINIQNTSLTGTISVNLIVFNPDCTGGANIVPGGTYCGPANGANFDVPGLTPGTIYYIQVGSSTAGEGTFNVCATEQGPPPGCSVNDDCISAENITGIVSGNPPLCTPGCNIGASPEPGLTGCNMATEEVVWYSFTSDNAAGLLSLSVSSNDITAPTVQVFTGNNCNGLFPLSGCVTGSNGVAQIVNEAISGNTTYFITVSNAFGTGGNFDLCVGTFEDLSACATESNLYVSPGSPSLGSPDDGPYQPGETVTFCFDLLNYHADPIGQGNNCQWLQGIVPVFGECWDAASFNPNASIPPTLFAGVWDWYDTGITYNFFNPNITISDFDFDGDIDICHITEPGCLNTGTNAGQILPPGWFASQGGGNPNNTFGDGAGCGVDMGPWNICFNVTTKPFNQCDGDPTATDCGVKIYTFADGETGSWNGGSSVCAQDIPQISSNTLNCCAGPILNPVASLPICSGGQTGIELTSDQDPNVTYTWTVLPSAVTGASDCQANCGNFITQILTNNTGAPQTVTYLVTPTAIDGCISPPSSITVTVLPTVEVSFAPIFPAICAGSCVTLMPITSAPGTYTYTWSDPNIFGQNPEVCPTISTTYTVTVTDANQCTAVGSVMVPVQSNLTVELTADPGTQICNNDPEFPINLIATVTAGGTGNYLYNWSPVAGASSIQPVFDIGTNLYCVTVTDAVTGCSGSECLQVTVDLAPFVTIIPVGPLPGCINDTTLMGIPSGGTWGGVADFSGTVYPSSLPEGPHDVTYIYTDPVTLCSETATYEIIITGTADVDDIPDPTECNSYTLPAITGTNLSGNQSYYDGPGGTGIPYSVGDVITSNITLYIYDGNVSCFDEEDLVITIINQPAITDIPDPTACDFYVLPAIVGTNLTGSQAYYSGTGGTGTTYNAGDTIFTSGPVFSYDGSGTCSDEEVFSVTITNQPDIDPVTDIDACNFYTLPAITGTDLTGSESYYSAAGGTGTAYAVGDMINASTTIFIYDGTTGCSDEESFMINIFIQPDIDAVQNQTACNTYALPAITGNNLSGTESYYSGPNGTGSTYAVGDNITADATIYIYDNAGIAGCEDEESFTVTIVTAPELDPVTNVTACDEYTLPGISGNNLSGTEAYYSGPGGTGTSYAPGDMISSNTNIFIYDNAGIAGCEDETSFSISITSAPELDPVGDVEACDEYILPAISGINLPGTQAYYTGSGGTGTSYSVGDAISADITLFVYASAGLVNCEDETSFSIDIFTSPVLDPQMNVTACDEYELPNIAGSDLSGTEAYYSGSGGTGTSYNPGDIISTNSTIYIYDNAGITGCEDEVSFTVNITSAPELDPLNNVDVCNSYTLPAITGVNLPGTEAYYTGTGGTGTSYDAGDVISSSVTLYIFASAGLVNCEDETSFDIVITPQPEVDDIPDPQDCNGYTLPAITGTNLSGSQAYYTGTNGSGTSYAPGDVINSTITLYIYDDAGLANCNDEESFTITIIQQPDIIAPANVDACDSYTLQAITGSNLTPGVAYFTGTNGTGTAYQPGDAITSSTTLYLYDQAGSAACSDEEQFEITINPTPTSDFTVTGPICTTGTSTVTFTGSAGATATYDWNFGGGAVISGSGEGPYEIQWSGAGMFSVSLIVEENGCTSTQTSQPITVEAPLQVPVINCNPSTTSIEFTWNDITDAAGYNVVVNVGPSGTMTSPTSYEVTGLAPNTTVEITVEAIGSGPCGSSFATFSCDAVDCPDISIVIDPVSDICLDGNNSTIQLNETIANSDNTGVGVWSGPGVTADGVFDPTDPAVSIGVNTITFTFDEVSCTFVESININVFQQPTATFTVEAPLCVGDVASVSYTGNASTAATYNWDFAGATIVSGSGQGPYEISWNTGSNYDITLTVTENGCASVIETVNVTLDQPLSPPVINCMTATDQIEFTWNDVPGADSYDVILVNGVPGVQNGNSYLVTGLSPDDSITITVIAIGSGACGNSEETETCFANNCPVISLALENPANDICIDGTQNPVSLIANVLGTDGTGTGSWSGPGITDEINGTFNPSDPSVLTGANTVTYTFSEQGCTYNQTLDITILAPPGADFGVQSPICQDQTCMVNYLGNANANAMYQWDFAGGTIVSGSGEGPYELAFNASGFYDITLTIIDENGCESQQVVQTVEVAQALTAPIISCMTTTSSIEFSWADIPGAADYQVTVLSGTTGVQNGNTYLIDNLNPDDVVEIEVTALGMAPCGNSINTQTCQATACPPIDVFIDPVADICLTQNTGLVFLSEEITGSDGTGIGVYSGQGITNPNGTFDPMLGIIGENIITYTFDEHGCIVVETISIFVFATPVANFTVTSPICEGDTSIIEATEVPGATYDWDFAGGTVISGSGFGPYEVSWSNDGSYAVGLIVTSADGCISSPATQIVEVEAPLEAPVINCNTSTSQIVFSWDDVTGAQGYTVDVIMGATGVLDLTNNTYTVTGLSPNDSVTIQVTVLGLAPCGDVSDTQTCYATDCPNILIDLVPVADFCVTADVLPFNLTANVMNNTDGTGVWSGNGVSSGGLFDPNDPSVDDGANTITYTFTEQGCPFIETMVINVNETPVVDAGVGGEISCASSQVMLSASPSVTNLEYLWTGGSILPGGETTPNPTVDQPGWYYVTLTNLVTGCFDTDSVFVDQGADLPTADAGPDGLLTCAISTLNLSAGPIGAGMQYEWDGPLDPTQVNLQNPLVTSPGMYILTVNDIPNSCSSAPDTVIVDIDIMDPVAIISNPLDPLDCELIALSLLGMEVPNATYEWLNSDGTLIATTPNVDVDAQGMYFFNVLDTINGCFASDSIEVIDNTDYPIIILAAPDDLNCSNSEIQLNASGSQTGVDITIEWTGPFNGISGPIDELSTTAVLPGLYTLTLMDTLNGCVNDTTLLVNQINDAPIAATNIPEELDCNTLDVEINGLNSIPGVGPLSYEWIYNSGSIAQTASTNVSDQGTYILVVTDSGNNCTDTTFVDVFESTNVLNSAIVRTAPPSCYGENDAVVFVDQVFGGTAPYQYSLDGTNFTSSNAIGNLVAGEYTLTIIDQEECTWDTTFIISSPTELLLDIGDDLLLQLSEDAYINAQFNIPETQIDTLIWSPMEMLVCIDSLSDNCKEVYAAPLNNLLVTATLSDTNGCTVTDEILLRVKKDKLVFIPNIFTPNNDNDNDIFFINAGQGVAKVNHFLVYDRWGEIMYEGHDFLPNDPSYGWDGTLRGEALNPAVFVYWAEVVLDDGQKVLFKGDVTLMR